MTAYALQRPLTTHEPTPWNDDRNHVQWLNNGAPHSITAHALTDLGHTPEQIHHTLTPQPMLWPSELLPRLGITVPDQLARWLDTVAREEDNGQSWAAAVNSAGDIPPTIPETDGAYEDVPDHLYHSDRDSLSNTGAKTILEPGGPAKLRYGVPKSNPAFDFGHVAHELVLGTGGGIVVVDAADWRTKDARAAKTAAEARGKTATLRDDYRRAEALADAVKSHPIAGELFAAEGIAERSIWAHDDKTGARIRCRPDWQIGTLMVDLKTTKSAAKFDLSIADYSYHLSAAFYLHTARMAGIDCDGFLLVAVEKEPPYLIDVVEIGIDDMDTGQRLTRTAIDLWARCHERNQWPGLPEILRTSRMPGWAHTAADTTISRALDTLTLIGENA